jgi:hypothetical protein
MNHPEEEATIAMITCAGIAIVIICTIIKQLT